ncbi:MAG: ATPase [Bacteroidetes bacterium]|nr:MAG: ATPase [Bacteroidota bacterium]
MKKIILIICITLSTVATIEAQSTPTHDSSISNPIDFSGNCGMCKRTIEKAAMISGVSSVEWDMESHEIVVLYDSTEISIFEIHQAIAASGYDTDKMKAENSTYDELPGCCQYERTIKE